MWNRDNVVGLRDTSAEKKMFYSSEAAYHRDSNIPSTLEKELFNKI